MKITIELDVEIAEVFGTYEEALKSYTDWDITLEQSLICPNPNKEQFPGFDWAVCLIKPTATGKKETITQAPQNTIVTVWRKL
jgi:hypothetical protein